MFFQQGLHVDALKIETILPYEFLNLHCVDHFLGEILKKKRR